MVARQRHVDARCEKAWVFDQGLPHHFFAYYINQASRERGRIQPLHARSISECQKADDAPIDAMNRCAGTLQADTWMLLRITVAATRIDEPLGTGFPQKELGEADLTVASWNRVTSWLQGLERLRCAA